MTTSSSIHEYNIKYTIKLQILLIRYPEAKWESFLPGAWIYRSTNNTWGVSWHFRHANPWSSFSFKVISCLLHPDLLTGHYNTYCCHIKIFVTKAVISQNLCNHWPDGSISRPVLKCGGVMLNIRCYKDKSLVKNYVRTRLIGPFEQE